MKREFFINVILLIGLNVLIKATYVLWIDRSVQNLAGNSSYGLYFTILNLTYLFQIINDFGIQNYNNQNIAKHPQLLPKLMPSIMQVKLGLAMVYALLLGTIAYFLGLWEQSPTMTMLLMTNQILVGFIYFFRSSISGLGHYRVDSVLSVMDKLIMVLSIGAIITSASLRKMLNIEVFVLIQTLSYLLTFLLAGGVMIRYIRGLWGWTFKPNLIRIVFKEALPFALLYFIISAYTRVDSVLLEQLLPQGEGIHEAGFYASAYRLVEAGSMIGILFVGLLIPMFSKEIKNTGSAPLAWPAMHFMVLLSAAITLPTMMHSAELMDWLYTHDDARSGHLLSILMLALFSMNQNTVTGALLISASKVPTLNKVLTGVLVITYIGHFIMVPTYHGIGTAWVVAGTQTLVMVLFLVLSIQFGLLQDWGKELRRTLYFMLGAGALAYLHVQFFPVTASIVVKMVTLGLLIMVWGVIVGMVTIPKQVWKNRFS